MAFRCLKVQHRCGSTARRGDEGWLRKTAVAEHFDEGRLVVEGRISLVRVGNFSWKVRSVMRFVMHDFSNDRGRG